MGPSATAQSQPVAPELLRQRARAYPDRTPISADGGGAVTYADWDRRADAVAHGLLARGVRAGDRVVLRFGQREWIDYAVAYFGVLRVGATAVHLNGREPAAELRRRLRQVAAVGTVRGTAVAPAGEEPGWTATVPALECPSDRPPDVDVPLDAVADILYTSGTTGPAKPFTVPHGNLSFGWARVVTAGFDGGPPMLAPMPMGTTSSANVVGNLALSTTGTIVLGPLDDPERIAALVERYGVGSVMLPPWIAIQMVDGGLAGRYDLTSVTTIGAASAPMPSPVARGLLAMMPQATIYCAYSQSEAAPAVVATNYDPDHPMCLGHPGPGTELRVAGPDGGPVADGEVGQVWLRSPAPRRRYLGGPPEPQDGTDGWYRTGDLGYLGGEGALYLFDRAAHAIRSGEHLVSSIEVEDVLYAHPAVREVAVFGVPEPVAGGAVGESATGGAAVEQEVVAAVVAREHADPAALATELGTFAADRLAGHQVPTVIEVVRSLPRGVTGKVRKHLLRQQHLSGDLHSVER